MRDESYFDTKIEVHLEPFAEEFNMYRFPDRNSSMNDVDSTGILDEYQRRFKDAWEKLAER